MIGLPSEHRKSQCDLLTRQLVRFEIAVKRERFHEDTDSGEERLCYKFSKLFCGRVTALNRGLVILLSCGQSCTSCCS